MPNFLNVKNNASSILAADITNVATSLTVASGEGARFPTSNFHITIDNEILKCTTRSGDVFTVTRAQEGTSAAAHNQGAAVRLNITAAIIQELQELLTERSCTVNRQANQSIPTNIWTAIQFDTEEWDTDNIFDPAQNTRLTCKTAGRYLISGTVRFAENTTGIRMAMICRNGSTTDRLANYFGGMDINGRWSASFTTLVNMIVDDYIELYVWQNTGDALNLHDTSKPRFSIIKMPF
jgi:hypothetical protein